MNIFKSICPIKFLALLFSFPIKNYLKFQINLSKICSFLSNLYLIFIKHHLNQNYPALFILYLLILFFLKYIFFFRKSKKHFFLKFQE